ncbi:hypothetical protein SAMN02745673_00148 [Marinactinospora thermotolerans DSM 45154]|uniref:Uncharacterized protein n=1 Tax=Marinactinospora thermotolerans DSM 45154 TaxID=1122192 RepID=A0A1T4K3Y4_9ACTN|nr:hypothetical protein [Marinactinospora thermotolerans]SJZ37037.1 hypothetical protein SAMN02745673_00148 [Marinactinospora thermotolerans DSM 45154]
MVDDAHRTESAESLRAQQRHADAEHAELVARITRALRRREEIRIPASDQDDLERIRRAARAAGTRVGRRVAARRTAEGDIVLG